MFIACTLAYYIHFLSLCAINVIKFNNPFGRQTEHLRCCSQQPTHSIHQFQNLTRLTRLAFQLYINTCKGVHLGVQAHKRLLLSNWNCGNMLPQFNLFIRPVIMSCSSDNTTSQRCQQKSQPYTFSSKSFVHYVLR